MESSKLINVVAQQFYGNRTGTEIRTDTCFICFISVHLTVKPTATKQ